MTRVLAHATVIAILAGGTPVFGGGKDAAQGGQGGQGTVPWGSGSLPLPLLRQNETRPGALIW